ncbi:MAG: hypothetical protein NZL91_03370 [Thermoflexales bacterium]|nr:hypothetical protein [Thermoflexales bacterium]MCS7325620.1 hypothetical protein [Thermoflexales bacterium]MCX7938902.1 hypothetical protein [Thermoflexales bacterium]MDW8054361.1 hypothetical protein [Anaerolineae bacterium]MDW8291477.1 hypothetical protein [Anaerolineae bacterium]
MAVLTDAQPCCQAQDALDLQALLSPARLGVLRCPICGTPYDAEVLRLIRVRNATLTLAAQCAVCNTGALLAIDTDQSSASDLSPAERIYFAAQPCLTEADVRTLSARLRALEDLEPLLAD